jgi:hypothetical protein
MMKTTRIGDLVLEGVEPGAVYLLRGGFGATETLHVMSKYQGGEVRGYHREEGGSAWALRHPAYPEQWTEIDQATANVTREEINHHRPGAPGGSKQLRLDV